MSRMTADVLRGSGYSGLWQVAVAACWRWHRRVGHRERLSNERLSERQNGHGDQQ